MGQSSSFITRALLNVAVSQCADLFATYFDGLGPAQAVSPEQLDAAARGNQPLLLNAVKQAPVEGIASVRKMFGSLAPEFRREQTGSDGSSLGHPYMWILQQDCLSRAHREHVQVILRHLLWYRQQMDAALEWLVNGSAS
jgi:hypothetical protein